MTKEDVIREITKNKKWYIGFYSQQMASNKIKMFWAGRLSEKKFNELIAAMGYRLEEPAKYGLAPFEPYKK